MREREDREGMERERERGGSRLRQLRRLGDCAHRPSLPPPPFPPPSSVSLSLSLFLSCEEYFVGIAEIDLSPIGSGQASARGDRSPPLPVTKG